MKKIIKGKVYDTNTARLRGDYYSPGSYRDFSHYEEHLYQKKTGEFFLHGEGGPMTKYAETVGMNEWSGGERIIPLDYNAAREWAEEHLEADEYEEIFGVVEENEGKMTATISVNIGIWEAAKRTASSRGIGISEYIESLIRKDMEEQK